MLWGPGEGSDIVDVWPVDLEVVGEEDNLVLQGEEAKASLCDGRRKFEKGSHSHCGRGETARRQRGGTRYGGRRQEGSTRRLVGSKQ